MQEQNLYTDYRDTKHIKIQYITTTRDIIYSDAQRDVYEKSLKAFYDKNIRPMESRMIQISLS